MAEAKKILSLDDFTAYVKKEFGKDSIVSAEEKEGFKEVIPTTPVSLKTALGVGGYPKGKIHTIDGEPSAGKSTILYDVIGNCQKTYGDMALLIDKEDSYTKYYGALLGIDNSKLLIVTPHTLEEMYDVVITALKSQLFGAIGVDSVTSFAPQARFEGSEQMGIESRVNSDKMRLVNDAITEKTALFLLQQVRSKIGGFGDPTTVSGGSAIPFYAHTRTRITRSEIDRELQQNVMKFTIIKNKFANPFKVGTVVYKWGEGFDAFSEIAELSMEFGIIKLKGKTYTLPESNLEIVGKKNMLAYLKDNSEYTKKVIEPLVSSFLANNNNLRPDDIDDSDIHE